MYWKFLLAGIFSIGLVACDETPSNREAHAKSFEIKFPAVMLVKYENGDADYLEGMMFGHISGDARYLFPDSVWGDCKGNYSNDGLATMACSNGYNFNSDYGKQKAKMSGVNIVKMNFEGQPTTFGFGWGKDANRAAVEAKM